MSGNAARDAAREAERAKLLYRHPRCVICSDPITYKRGRNHRSRTCGKRSCTVARWNWTRPGVRHGQRRCRECVGPIPPERNGNSIYCSRKCNALRNGRITARRWRERRRVRAA